MQRKWIGISVSTLLLAAIALHSQTNQARIYGTVTDMTGAVIPNAPVEVKNTANGQMISTKTGDTGNYSVNFLSAGVYSLEVKVSGFKTFTHEGITLASGQSIREDIVLEVGQASESVTVTAQPSLLKTESYQLSTDQLNNLPILAIGAGQQGQAGRAANQVQVQASQFAAQYGVAAGAVTTIVVNGTPVAGFYDRNGRFQAYAGNEQYGHYVENEFVTPQDAPLSTFGTDVDTASYSNIRRFLTSGQLPPPESVRIEELVNYFRYDYPLPERGKPVSMTSHVIRNPWNPDRLLMQVGLRTAPIATEDLPPSHLTFLIDVSGSMSSSDKLPLVQQSLQMLARQMRPQDTVALAVYAGAAGVVLPPTRGDRQPQILDAIGRLQAGGSTAGAAGIRLAYQLARQSFAKNANNRVILATDGDFNVGMSSDDELVRLIEQERKSGVFLSVLGFGTGNLKDAKMEKLADHGNGNYAYIDSLAEARKVFVEEMGATLVTVAKDVKLQIEFNPARVKEYRLIGYENRLLRPEDFNDDTKDAGDLGAGHQVTAFYEIVPVGGVGSGAGQDGLRYQQQETPAPRSTGRNDGAHANEFAWVKLRHKAPQSDTSALLEWPVGTGIEEFRSAPRDVRFAVAVAEYGLLLRQSKFAGQASFDHVMQTASEAVGQDLDGYRTDFIDLVRRAANLKGAIISRR